MTRLYTLLSLAIILSPSLRAQSRLPLDEILFRYQYNMGDQFRYEGFLYQEASYNGSSVYKGETHSTVSARVLSTGNGWATLENNYRQSIKNSAGLSRLTLLEDSRFQQNERGEYRIDRSYMFPAVRSIPSFPKKPVKIGDKWQAQAEEKFDLGFLNAGKVATQLRVNYVYEGIGKKEGKDYHKISASYRPYLDMGTVSVRGKVKQVIYWDNERGNIAYYDDEFEFQFSSGGNTYSYKGISNGKRVDSLERQNKENWEEQLEASLKAQGLTNVSVQRNATGIKLILGDVYFEPGTAQFITGETTKLTQIANILKSYPVYTLLIEGHTAKLGTVQEQLDLSDARAHRVGEYLQAQGFKAQAPLLFKGWGAEKPFSRSQTPEALQKNRRVEITLLEN